MIESIPTEQNADDGTVIWTENADAGGSQIKTYYFRSLNIEEYLKTVMFLGAPIVGIEFSGNNIGFIVDDSGKDKS